MSTICRNHSGKAEGMMLTWVFTKGRISNSRASRLLYIATVNDIAICSFVRQVTHLNIATLFAPYCSSLGGHTRGSALAQTARKAHTDTQANLCTHISINLAFTHRHAPPPKQTSDIFSEAVLQNGNLTVGCTANTRQRSECQADQLQGEWGASRRGHRLPLSSVQCLSWDMVRQFLSWDMVRQFLSWDLVRQFLSWDLVRQFLSWGTVS